MRHRTFALGLAASAVAVTLVALAYGIIPHRSSSGFEPRHAEASLTQTTSSTDTEANESTAVVPRRSADNDQKPAVTAEALSDTIFPVEEAFMGEEAVRKEVRERATRNVQTGYSLLIAELDLTPKEKEALISLLIEDRIASTQTFYSPSQPINEHERASRIAAIIGESKLQKLLALERNLPAYWEAQKISLILQQNGVPIADTQRDGVVKILIGVREEPKTIPRSDVKLRGIEYLEHKLAQRDEYERHVIELAPSVLSPEQVRYLFEQYQYLSYQRADALERQKEARADPMTADLPPHYPIWGD